MLKFIFFGAGIALGLGLAHWKDAGGEFSQTERITVARSDLRHILKAVVMAEDQPGFKFVSNTGSIQFECPGESACNLSVSPREPAIALEAVRPKLAAIAKSAVATKPLVAPAPAKDEVDRVISRSASVAAVTETEMHEGEENAGPEPEDEEGEEPLSPVSLFERLGIQNGDTVKSINGEAVASPAEAFTRLQAMASEKSPIRVITVIRAGQEVEIAPGLPTL